MITRIAIGAGVAGLAVSMTGCKSGSHKAAARTKPSAHGATAVPVSANWSLKCTDPQGDVTSHGSRNAAPAWSDLTSVAWEREPGLVRVAFTTAGPLSLAQPGKATYTTVVRAGLRTARVDAALSGGDWRVTSGSGDEKKELAAAPSIEDGAVLLNLPGRLPAGDGTIDMGKKVDVSASAEIEADGGVYEDADCGASAPNNRRKRHYIAFPVERDTPTPWRTTPRWKAKKTGKPASRPTAPVAEPTHASTPSGPRPTSRPRTPSKPRTHR
ncbi:hypothetical protein [Actinomadura sp. NTSP31]|uniref:hypothetical protein n=1 Tax=Actinomadura sp. NTSP31 TaxID=1735447 RepID=UPI0035BF9A7C